MKKTLGIIMACALLLCSCSKNEEPTPQLPEKTYTGANILTLNYCDEAMPGKYVKFTPTDDMSAATLLLGSDLDLSQIPGMSLTGILPAAGVLPGDATYPLHVSLKAVGDHYTFSGSETTNYLSFSYNGEVTADNLTLNITDAKLKNPTIAGLVVAPDAIKRSPTDILQFESFPFHVAWDVAPIPELASIQIPLASLLENILAAPIIPVYHNTAYSSLAELYVQAVQTIAFLESGNIVTRYFSSSDGATQLMTMNGNTFQYILSAETQMQLYINPLSVMGLYLTNKGNGYSGDEEITWKTMPARSGDSSASADSAPMLLAKMLTQGIPVQLAINGNDVTAYLNTETILPFISNFLLPMLQDETVMQKLLTYLQSDAHMSDTQLAQVKEILALMPLIVANTTRLESGLNFHKFQQA